MQWRCSTNHSKNRVKTLRGIYDLLTHVKPIGRKNVDRNFLDLNYRDGSSADGSLRVSLGRYLGEIKFVVTRVRSVVVVTVTVVVLTLVTENKGSVVG